MTAQVIEDPKHEFKTSNRRRKTPNEPSPRTSGTRLDGDLAQTGSPRRHDQNQPPLR